MKKPLENLFLSLSERPSFLFLIPSMGLSKMLLECEMRFKLGILGEGIPFSKDPLILLSFKILRGTLSI